jgi:hypothetical protein
MRVPRIVENRRTYESAAETILVFSGVGFFTIAIWALAIWKMADLLA